jgi:predicted O-linked N-acetylglucosamine transferase (SPINDLY family)
MQNDSEMFVFTESQKHPFFVTYETIMSSFPTHDQELLVSWYDEGIRMVKQHAQNPPLCTKILHMLLLIFPKNPELYYFMGCVQKSLENTCKQSVLYWFQKAFQEFENLETQNSYQIENTLDFFKFLFECNYMNYIQYLMDTNEPIFQKLLQIPCDPRWLLFLIAYYIKSNQLKHATHIYNLLQQGNIGSYSKDLQYKIYNNCLIMHTHMANFERIPELLRRNFEICHSMKDDTEIEWNTKKHVFCSNMLHYDYMYHDHQDHRNMCLHVETYFPKLDDDFFPKEEPLLDLSFTEKIRVGYISSDFVEHAVSHFILPILEHHNLEEFEVTLFVNHNYSTIITEPQYARDCQRHRIVNLQHLSTENAVAKIREFNIQLLIDLNGYTEGHRLDILAQRPAPIQISYLGFPNTVGSAHILQYRITDHIADLPDSQQWFAEQRLYMSRCFLLYRSLAQTSPLPFLNGNSPFFPWIVLGAMNRESKNSDEVLQCWRTILEKTQHTKILIKLSSKEHDEIHMENYRKKLCIGGVLENRILFAKYGSTTEYFRLFSFIDVLLDTFPYSGTTTTCNALYNSVPVITLSQRDLHAHNVSASILTHCGMSEWVTTNPQDYIHKVIEWVTCPVNLATYRGNEHEPGEVHRRFVEGMMRPEPFMKEYEGILRDVYEKK